MNKHHIIQPKQWLTPEGWAALEPMLDTMTKKQKGGDHGNQHTPKSQSDTLPDTATALAEQHGIAQGHHQSEDNETMSTDPHTALCYTSAPLLLPRKENAVAANVAQSPRQQGEVVGGMGGYSRGPRLGFGPLLSLLESNWHRFDNLVKFDSERYLAICGLYGLRPCFWLLVGWKLG